MIVGIDLGTTNSLVGVYDSGFVTLIADQEGERLTPSLVYFAAEGEVLVGRAAVRMRTLAPRRTVYSAKRFMGGRVGEEQGRFDYSIVGQAGAPVRFGIGEKAVSPEEVAAHVLGKLKADAERALGRAVEKAVVTVPAYFNDAQRNATKRAGELAGLEVVRILNEPTAAALAYGLDRLEDRARVAVYDLGGGTFDISILELNQGVFQVLATNGDTRLGGDDVDGAIVEYLAAESGVTAREDCERRLAEPSVRARLREAAVDAKHRLSSVEQVEVALPFLDGEQSRSIIVTRELLERLARPILERTRIRCVRALADAGLRAEDLHEVVLVGGSTRMPMVRSLVAEIFGRSPNTSQNPDEAVANGAALQAAIMDGALRDVVLLDVTPLSLGIETFGGLMNVIVPRNTTIPFKAGEMFTNAVAGQRSMLIRVLQGEREKADDNWELGRFEIPFEALPKGQARVGVQFEIDENGILKVLARDTNTGSEKIVEMASAVDVSDEAVEKMLEDSLEHAFEDMNARIYTEAKLKAEEMLPSVEKAIALVGEKLSVAEKQAIRDAMSAVESAMQSNAAQQLKKAVTALDDVTQVLATLLVESAMNAASGSALKTGGVTQ
jgi:molecular chaperone DnaK